MADSVKLNPIRRLAQWQQAQISAAGNIRGQDLPCHVVNVRGAIVTVQFDILPGTVNLPQVTIPVMGFEYIRCPIQKGDKGVAVSASVSLRGVSGLGTGLADMSMMPSLTSLFFVPVGNINWEAVEADRLVMWGPSGVLLRTEDGSASISIEQGKIVLKAGADTLEIGAGLKHNGINVGSTHVHGGVQSGSSQTKGPQ